jgi:hypothetical protein
MSDKKLLNERMFVLAGIKPVTSIGCSSPSKLDENSEETEAKISSLWNAISAHIGLGNSKPLHNWLKNNNPNMDISIARDLINQFHFGKISKNEFQSKMLTPASGEADDYVNHVMNESEEVSSCCGAPIKMSDICSNCGEHTEPQSYENETLNENTIKEQLGIVKPATQYKAHDKGLISERAFDMVGGIVYPQTMKMSRSGPQSDQEIVSEVQSDLSRNELFNTLQHLQSSLLMELAEEYTSSPAGKQWGDIVEDLSEAYLNDASARKTIHLTLQKAGLV